MIVLVARSHPEPTQTFHRRTARALADLVPGTIRLALRRSGHAPEEDGTRFVRDEGGRAGAAFLRAPLRATGLLLRALLAAHPGNKEGGLPGAAAAWLDGLRLADWGRRVGGVERFHAQFASWEATAALVAARLRRCAFSFEVHNPATFVTGRRMLRWKLRAADVVPVISEDARARAAALAPDAAPRLALVRCGIDLRAVPRASGAGPDVVAVGSLVPRKGHDVLVRALARLAPSRPGLRAVVVGEGPERARLEALVRETGAPVRLVGALPEAEAWALAASARVAALACRVAPDGDEDGIPVALVEAMAAGVPVVSTPVGGIAELLEGGEAGLLVPAGDDVGLAVALGRLLDEAPLRVRLVERGRRAVAARHDLSGCARALAAALRPRGSP